MSLLDILRASTKPCVSYSELSRVFVHVNVYWHYVWWATSHWPVAEPCSRRPSCTCYNYPCTAPLPPVTTTTLHLWARRSGSVVLCGEVVASSTISPIHHAPTHTFTIMQHLLHTTALHLPWQQLRIYIYIYIYL